jgi:HK97 family phage major capsid protein
MAEAMSLRELDEKIKAKRAKVSEIFAACPKDGDEYKMTAEQIGEVRGLNAELKELTPQFEELKGIQEMRSGWEIDEDEDTGRKQRRELVPNGDGKPKDVKGKRPDSIKSLLRESPGYLAFQSGRVKTFSFELDDVELKTLLTLGDITPQAQRRPGIVQSAQAFRSVEDLFAHGTINSNVYEYYEETTFTNAAAETDEGSAKPEAALDFTLRTDTMRKIPVWLPATSEVLEDNDALESYIRERLRFMVIKRRDGQLLNGDGTAPNISGITDRSGIQTQAKGSDPVFDAILKAMTKVRVTGDAEPTGIVMHPNDWQDLVLTRTTDGIYIMGNPSDPEVGSSLWGLMVRNTPQQTENTAIVGAFTPMAQVFRKPNSAITVTISTEHSTYFVENKVAILAEERLLLAVYRPAAFCTVTSI